MVRKSALAIGFLLLLALVAKPIWLGREQWHIGQGSDDGVYWVTAKAIATGQGYRVPSLPGDPYAVKYPPLYPAFLSIAWLIHPDSPGGSPGNVRLAAVMQALLLPIYLALLLAVLRRFGFSWRRVFLVAAITLVTLQTVLLTITLFSELLCLCLLLAAILAAEHAVERSVESSTDKGDAVIWALVAGLLAGLAYLTRNAVLPIFGAAPLYFFLKKKPRLAIWFLLPALPLAASWHIWTFLHAGAANDATNASYIGEYLRIIGVNGLASNFLKQLTAFSGAVSDSVEPGFIEFVVGLPLYHLAAAAAISGGIRIGYRRGWPLYLIFSALYCLMILLWWFEGMTRLIIPAWPALVAGMSEEVAHVATLFEKSMARSPFWSKKFALWLAMPRWILIGLGFATVLRNDSITYNRIANVMRHERQMRLSDEAAFSWIAQHKTPNTVVLAWKDTITYLYTGAVASRSLFIDLTPQTAEFKAVGSSFAALPPIYTRGLFLVLQSDLGEDSRMDAFQAAAESQPGSNLEFSSPTARIYSFPIPR